MTSSERTFGLRLVSRGILSKILFRVKFQSQNNLHYWRQKKIKKKYVLKWKKCKKSLLTRINRVIGLLTNADDKLILTKKKANFDQTR